MPTRRDAFARGLAVTFIVATAPTSPTLCKDRWPVERGPVPSHMNEARAETFQAIAISRMAERFCDGAYVFHEKKAEDALRLLYLDSIGDVPSYVDHRYMGGSNGTGQRPALSRTSCTRLELAVRLRSISSYE